MIEIYLLNTTIFSINLNFDKFSVVEMRLSTLNFDEYRAFETLGE